MTLIEISNGRLKSQKVSEPEFKNPKEIVSWMGAMQAQDFPMSKWAIGAIIDPVFFKKPDKHNLKLLRSKVNLFGKFLNKDTEIRNNG